MKRLFLFLALGAWVVLPSPAALAQSAGFNLFQTGSGTIDDLSGVGLGVVSLQGVPIDNSTGNADTIIQRLDAIPPGGGTIRLNVNALFLKSTNPITFQGQSVDVYVTVNNSGGVIPTAVLPQPDALAASGGTATVRLDGTFDLKLTINADVILVRAGTSVTDPQNYVGHRPGTAIQVSSTNTRWQQSPPSNYPISQNYPGNGFYPPVIQPLPHPVILATAVTAVTSGQTASGGKQ